MGPKRNVYAIYASQDKNLAHELIRHLQLLEKDFNVSIWHDDPIYPKQHWKPKNASRLNQADIFLLLVSDAFMHSEFIQQDEFKTLIDRYKAGESIVIPILLDNCPWDIEFNSDDYDFSFKELQVLPEDRKPISDWKSSDKALEHVIDRVKKTIPPIDEDFDLEIPNENLDEKTANALREEQIALNFKEEREAKSMATEANSVREEAETKKRVEKEKKHSEATESKRVALEEKRLREEADAIKSEEQELKLEEDAQAKKKAEEEKRDREEAGSKRIALEEKRLREEAEVSKREEQELKLEEDAQARKKAEEEKRDREEAESKRIALKEEGLREETQAKQRAEEEKRLKEEAESKRIALEEETLKEEAEAKKIVHEQKRLKEKAEIKKRAEVEKRRAEEAETKRIEREAITQSEEAQAKKREAKEYWEKGEANQLQYAARSNENIEEIRPKKNKSLRKKVLVGLVAALAVAGIWFFNTGPEKPVPTLPDNKVTAAKDSTATDKPKVDAVKQGASFSKLGVGDTHEGGLIFAIDPSGTSGKIAYSKDAGPMPWAKANTIHEQLGEGWRLPTLDELRTMYRTIGQGATNSGRFADELYWSATPFDTYQARLLRFRDGNASYHYNKGVVNRKFHVRAVRDFSR